MLKKINQYMKNFDYENSEYLQKLGELSPHYYAKYTSHIEIYVGTKNAFFLDVGCGNGSVLSSLKKKGYQHGYGVDVSKLFVQAAKKQGIKNVFVYDGKKLPFTESNFTVVGSFNVLEHTANPEYFLREQLRVLKHNGYIIVACPNFLSSVMQSSHPRVNGIIQKVHNAVRVIGKLFDVTQRFERMDPIIRSVFQYDDDAIVVTNLLDLRRVLSLMNCSIIYESGFIQNDSGLTHLIDVLPIVKYMMPSCFIVARKN